MPDDQTSPTDADILATGDASDERDLVADAARTPVADPTADPAANKERTDEEEIAAQLGDFA